MILKILGRDEGILANNDYLGFAFGTDNTAYNTEFVGNLADNSNFKNFLPNPDALLAVQDIESIYLDEFAALFEIPLLKEPNQRFDIYLDGESFILELRTNTDENTFLSIWNNKELITTGTPVSNTAVNLAYFSDFQKGAFFFLYNKNALIDKFNFLQFGDNLRLYYGSFQKSV